MIPRVQGHCPECGGDNLILGRGGYVTCSRSGCPRPDAASDVLADTEIHHIVELRRKDFTVQHPLRERLVDGGLFDCPLHAQIADLDGPPRKPGRYRVYGFDLSSPWEEVPDDPA